MDKIIENLHKIRRDLEHLRGEQHSEGEEEYQQILQLIRRIIDRIYPEKQAENLKRNLIRIIFSGEMTDEAQEQENYLYDLNSAIRVVTTLIKEGEIFGFQDFKPLKEKTETTVQLGSERFGGFFRKKKTK